MRIGVSLDSGSRLFGVEVCDGFGLGGRVGGVELDDGRVVYASSPWMTAGWLREKYPRATICRQLKVRVGFFFALAVSVRWAEELPEA